MQLAFFAKNQPHFCSFMAPIYLGLPDEVRGKFYARARAAERCKHFGIEPVWPPPRFKNADTVVVASYEDYRSVRPAKVVFVNHGAGQSYVLANGERNHPAYSGGSDRERTILFIEPSERAAALSRAAYPDIPIAIIGPPPYMDKHLRYTTLYDPQLVAISFHTDAGICPESRSAFPYYRKAIIELARSGRFKLLGHAHPRAVSTMSRFWASIDVEFEPDWLKVLDRAGVYVIDNSSSGFEFAATRRPVLWLNAPWYRHNIEHGLRFWDSIPGYQLDTPEDLAMGIEESMKKEWPFPWEEQLDRVYGLDYLDGRSTERAVAAILSASNLAKRSST